MNGIIQEKIYPDIQSLLAEIEEIIQNSNSISVQDLRSESIAIVGPPNSGKSSLINFILGDKVSIVSDIEGTTRDAVEKNLVHQGNEYKLIDLAGLRALDNDSLALHVSIGSLDQD